MRLPPKLSRSALFRAVLRTATLASTPFVTPPAFAGESILHPPPPAPAASSSCLAGYYELELPVGGTNVLTSVWAPMSPSSAATATPTGSYRTTGTEYEALRAFTPFPPWLCRLLASGAEDDTYVQTASAFNVSAAGALRPRGAILMAHGLAATRLDYAPLAESLARHGFLVAAPDFADSYLRQESIFAPEALAAGLYTVSRGRLCSDAIATRAATLESLGVALRSSYGDQLKFGLFGFSLGGSTIQALGWSDAPKVYVASPVARPAALGIPSAEAAGRTDAPSLQILGIGGDEYREGDTFVPTEVALAALPATDRKEVSVDYLQGEGALPSELPSRHTSLLFENAGHLMLSGAACDFKVVTQPDFSPDTRFAARTGAHVQCLQATVALATDFFDRQFA
jgi:dienelactone hydrolase